MAYRLNLTAEAKRDIDDAILWYKKVAESQVSRFLDELAEYLFLIEQSPDIFRIRKNKFRLANLKIFPYQIIYTIAGEEIKVLAVFHAKQNPNKWVKRNK